ncbi:hypothetical protein [Elioraea thermophila]|uniref:hypothetical protein n=1 Tax=Elioraea thermophila TaxID=2185104 RepID=UPI0013005296|nr:hypothetical protein [Elioraea thermophila]
MLATAANERVAHAIADHLGLFDEVIASGTEHNLEGSAKAAAVVARFGERGFSYAGDSAAGAAVWRQAGAAVLVGPAARRPPPLRPRLLSRLGSTMVAAKRCAMQCARSGDTSGRRTCSSSCR